MNAELPLLIEVVGGVAWLTLNRPEASNALNPALVAALADAVDAIGVDEVRCVVVKASGARFCGGGDISTFVGELDQRSAMRESAARGEAVVRSLGELKVPVIVAVHGAVAGAGLSFVLNADVVIAARSARFVPAYAGLGLTPDLGVSYLLPRIVGERRAALFLLSGKPLSADEAERWGLVSEVVDDDDLLSRATEFAEGIAAGSPFSMAAIKRLLRSSSGVTRAVSAADEAETIAAALATDIARSRINTFLSRT